MAVVCVALAWAALPAVAQVSPGPLAEAHRELDATLKCFECHRPGSASMDESCLACHEGIGWLVERGRGLHARTDEECATCHPDHAGRDFELIDWEEGAPEKFDHTRTGWPTDGAHAALKCRDCHKQELRLSPVVDLLRRTRRDGSWVGLGLDCLSCHQDRHLGALSVDCLECHTNRKWKPASGFDHARSSYPLDGKHRQLSCDKCHKATRPEEPPLYKPLQHGECSDCHRDVHEGRLGPACAKCHSVEGFDRLPAPGGFDHELTRYPLRGGHRKLECAECHELAGARVARPRFATCDSCHSDPHSGRATLAGKKVDCAACHRVEDFRSSTYDAARHDSSKYPLRGRHRQVKCLECHPRNPPEPALLRPAHELCTDCHRDAHGGQLAATPRGEGCESCHRVDGWKPSTFTIGNHADAGYPLEGRHLELECAACHGPLRAGLPPLPGPDKLGRARIALVLAQTNCIACHVDPHLGRFEPGGERPVDESCNSCHTMTVFRPATVDARAHERLGYALDGAHRAVPCVACHEELALPPSDSSLLLARERLVLGFGAEHGRCSDCHADAHGAQFAERTDLGACDSCHGLDSFVPAPRFDHDRDSAFRLKGAHENVPCLKCHPLGSDASGRETVSYRPIPRECKSCHLDGGRRDQSVPSR